MNPSAQVYSLDRLKRLHEALSRFANDAQTALGVADRAIRHIDETLDERLTYWQQQVNRRREEVGQARSALAHARALHDGSTVGCIEQELAVRKAQDRLREAEEKVVIVRRWQRELPTFAKDYDGPSRGLTGFIESDLRRAIVLLENKIATLEAYQKSS
jgi:hypothetical protein